MERCREFFKKMEKLDLLEEVEENKYSQANNGADDHTTLERESSMYSSMTGTGITQRRLMKSLSLIQMNPEAQYMEKSFMLNRMYQQNMLEIMSENLQLQFLQKEKACKSQRQNKIENESKERWLRLIYFLLNIEWKNHQNDEQLKHYFAKLLQDANYMEQKSRAVL